MKSIYCVIAVLLSFSLSLTGQSFWSTADNFAPLKSNENPYSNPSEYKGYDLDFQEMKQLLKTAPKEVVGKRNKGIALDIPFPNGEIITFHVYESSVMQEGIQKRYPNIKSYKGYDLNSNKIIRFDTSPKGFFGAVATDQGTVYIDPYSDKQIDKYVSYYVRNDQSPNPELSSSCGYNPAVHGHMGDSKKEQNETEEDYKSAGNEPVDFRIYRFAISTTAQWTKSFGGTVEAGLMSLNTSVNRLNLIFENEFAMRLVLVNDNDKIIFTDEATHPFSDPTQGGEMIGYNTGLIAGIIGRDNFDIGHVYANCTDTGGIASLNSACGQNKAAGASCFMRGLMGTTLSVVTHELGHQMGANHTFNNCSGNENQGTGMEPGSGSTIMSYAGLCASQFENNNIQGDNDDYYHAISLVEIKDHMFTGNGNTCAERIPTENISPEVVIDYTNGFFIPIGTPFLLEGYATDANGDSLTYNWEQFDTGTQSVLGTPMNNAPSFRSLYPSPNPTRMFPGEGGLLDNVNNRREVLPTYDRRLTFRLVARDNNPMGGATDWEEVRFEATSKAGPFELLYPNSYEQLTAGETVEVRWDVANTDQDPVNCKFVNIELSTDGGFNFDTLLLEETANDGSHNVIIPNLPGDNVRIRVKAADNIFFDISNFPATISEPTGPTYFMDAVLPTGSQIYCLPSSVTIPIETSSFLDFNEDIEFEVVSGLPDGATATFSQSTVSPGESTTLSIDIADARVSDIFEVVFKAKTASNIEVERSFFLNIVSNDFSDLATNLPSKDQREVGVVPVFEWANDLASETYKIEVATSPAFGESMIIEESGLTETSFSPNFTLDAGTLYYWRISGSNICGASSPTPVRLFHTIALSCTQESSSDTPINISSSGTRKVEAFVNFNGSLISDVNVRKASGTHERVSDLSFSLMSPDSTVVVLLERKCFTSNFNLKFDDESPNPISCPLTSPIPYTPVSPLSAFNGGQAEGLWTFIINDDVPGAGGQLSELILEVCSGVTVQNPFIVNNESLQIPPGDGPKIRTELLSVADDNNTDNELRYTMITLPRNGDLSSNNGAPLLVGSTFTQSDINNGMIRYSHDGGTSLDADYFEFVVEDGEGGWIEVTRFDIQIDADFVSNTNELQESLGINVFPNPAQNILHITSNIAHDGDIQCTLLDIQGKSIITRNCGKTLDEKISVKDLIGGIYFVKIATKSKTYTERIVILD